jgi:predicted nucleic acid-binding protein
MVNYYFDTCIWRDHYENRFGPKGRPLGSYASKLFMQIMINEDIILFSDLLVKELKIAFDQKDVEEMLNILSMMNILRRIDISSEERSEAKKLSSDREVSFGDALHAVLARNNNAILVTQNEKDFKKLIDISEYAKPEHLL